MAWTKTSARGWTVASETVTLASGVVAGGATAYTSVIDWLPYGKDFSIEIAHTATLATDCTVQIAGSDSPTGTFFNLATTSIGTIEKAASQDDFGTYDVSAKVQMPYYKITLVPTGGAITAAAGKTVTYKVFSAPPTEKME